VNQLRLSATVLEIAPLRHTPAGQPVQELVLHHASQVQQADAPRDIALHLHAVAMGDVALMLAGTPLGTELWLEGFLAPRRQLKRGQAKSGLPNTAQTSGKLVLHIQQVSAPTAQHCSTENRNTDTATVATT